MSRGVIVDPHHTQDWIVPRRVMCAFFWVGILLLFTGIILLVTSKHKGKVYQSWGAILLGLGFCLLLICLILCVHAYCVITINEDDTLMSKYPRHVAPPAPPASRMMNGRKPPTGRIGEPQSILKPGIDNPVKPVQHCVVIEKVPRAMDSVGKETDSSQFQPSPSLYPRGTGSAASSPLLPQRHHIGDHINPIGPSTSQGDIVDACDGFSKTGSQSIYPTKSASNSSLGESGIERCEVELAGIQLLPPPPPPPSTAQQSSSAQYPVTSSSSMSFPVEFVKSIEVTAVNPGTVSIPASSVVLASEKSPLTTIPEDKIPKMSLPAISEHDGESYDEDLAPEIGHVHIIGVGDHPSDSSIQSLNAPLSQSSHSPSTPDKDNPIVMYLQEAKSTANQIPKIPMTSSEMPEPIRTRRPTGHQALMPNRTPTGYSGFEPYRPSQHAGSTGTWTSSVPMKSNVSQIKPVRGPLKVPLTPYLSQNVTPSVGDPRRPDQSPSSSASTSVASEAQGPEVNKRQSQPRVVHLTKEDILSSKLSIYDNVQYVYHGDQVQKPGPGQRHQFSF